MNLSEEKQLSIANHDRDVVGMRYVYPVVSRRAGGVSIGINLNPNHACNWACVYCQVPNLTRGSAPDVDLPLLESEFHSVLADMMHGDFMQQHVPESMRRLCDVAISGNGEPTSCQDFDAVVQTIVRVMQAFDIEHLPLRLITNGSYMRKKHVQAGLARMAKVHGEVWLKVDAVREKDIASINGVQLSSEQVMEQLRLAASLCPTWIQTCMFAWQGVAPDEAWMQAYVGFLQQLISDGVPIQGVFLYGVAREVMQGTAKDVSVLPLDVLERFAEMIRAQGVEARVA